MKVSRPCIFLFQFFQLLLFGFFFSYNSSALAQPKENTVIVVQEGETLSLILKRLGFRTLWGKFGLVHKVAEDNSLETPDKLKIGQRIVITTDAWALRKKSAKDLRLRARNQKIEQEHLQTENQNDKQQETQKDPNISAESAVVDPGGDPDPSALIETKSDPQPEPEPMLEPGEEFAPQTTSDDDNNVAQKQKKKTKSEADKRNALDNN